ncbi:MAG: FAD-binding oxidoreductase, partial [Chlamydiales bacterium]|nr:FAD-binding oxidoreductase [Chlamydiales bacterium]
MVPFSLTHPTATIARGIEDIVIYGECSNLFIKGACAVGARAVSIVVFPVFLTLELFLKRIPKMLLALGTETFDRKADKSLKFILSIIPSIVLGIHSPEGVPGFFVKRQKNDREIRPFGVEKVFGLTLKEGIFYPTTPQEVQTIVQDAKKRKQQVVVMGAGMSQGIQTVPINPNQCVINMKYLNRKKVNIQENTVTVEAGATWEEVQLALDEANKSAIVKQASDIFSVGGTIGMNAHGWAHRYGPISKTVRSLKVVNAEGDLRVLSRPRDGVSENELTDDELLFKCMFGTLGYFGVVVEATLDIVDNDVLIESTQEIERDQFTHEYEKIKADPTIPLFGGRLVLDTLEGDPLRTICMVSYRTSKDQQGDLAKRKITEEPKWGTRIQRIGLKLISHLSYFSVKRLISYFWQQEKTAMFSGRVVTRNEALHPPINAFKILHHSDLHAQWL